MLDKVPSARIRVHRDINDLDSVIPLKDAVCDGHSCCALQIGVTWCSGDDIIDGVVGHQIYPPLYSNCIIVWADQVAMLL